MVYTLLRLPFEQGGRRRPGEVTVRDDILGETTDLKFVDKLCDSHLRL